MAAAANGEAKKLERGDSTGTSSGSQLLFSTTYSLNASDSKRMQVGLRVMGEDAIFEPTIKLLGNSASGIQFDPDSWTEFKARMEEIGYYLRAVTRDAPSPILLKSGIVVNFTSAYGSRAIMVTHREKTQADIAGTATTTATTAATTTTTTTTTAMANSREDRGAPPAKKRKLYSPSIVMQRVTYEGLANITKCIDAKYEQLQMIANSVSECCRLLTSEIELNLPRDGRVDEDVVRLTLANRYAEIEGDVRRQLKDLPFIDFAFGIVFSELASIFLYVISRRIIHNRNIHANNL